MRGGRGVSVGVWCVCVCKILLNLKDKRRRVSEEKSAPRQYHPKNNTNLPFTGNPAGQCSWYLEWWLEVGREVESEGERVKAVKN